MKIYEYAKAPRWIRTPAGQWAWQEHRSWRDNAANALSVRDRSLLLEEAEQLQHAQVGAAPIGMSFLEDEAG